MGLLGLLGKIGSGINAGIDRGVNNSLLSATGGSYDPTAMDELQRRAMRSSFLMNLGSGIKAGDLGAGVQGFQQQAVPMVQAGRMQAGLKAVMAGPGTPAEKYTRLGDFYAQAGQPDKAKIYYDVAEKMKPVVAKPFGELTKGVDAEGNPVFIGRNDQNVAAAIPGFKPAPEEMTPYQKAEVERQAQQTQLDNQKFMEGQYQTNRTARNANLTEEQLTAKALAGDKEAQGVLDAMQKRKVEIAQQSRPVNQFGIEDLAPPDPASNDILSQTGLSVPGFYALVGENAKLPRDAATRIRAMKEAGDFARKRGVDIATLASQYKTYNTVLGGNISRLNNTKIMESELQGTIQNLQGVVDSQGLSRVNFANVAKIWAGQQVNDGLAQQYSMHLSQLRNELTAYYAATQGRTGNNITLDDKREAEGVIRNGISTGSLKGLSDAVANSTEKMGTVMQRSVDNAGRAVWDLFGVGGNYKSRTPAAAQQTGGSAATIVQYSASTGQYRYSKDGSKTWTIGRP